MAKKYGIGENIGKKATTWMATAPDGTLLKKKSYNVHEEPAFMATYQSEGKWIPSGVQKQKQDWGSQQWLPANLTK